MKIKKVSFTRSVTLRPADYESLRIEVSLEAEREEGEKAGDVIARLDELASQELAERVSALPNHGSLKRFGLRKPKERGQT